MISLLSGTAFADDPIKITISDTLDDVIFDGAWSFGHEWKASTLDEFRFNDDDLVLRTAHQDDYMYVLIDVLGDMTNDHMADRAIVCLDGKRGPQRWQMSLIGVMWPQEGLKTVIR